MFSRRFLSTVQSALYAEHSGPCPSERERYVAAQLNEIWLAPSTELARQRAKQLSEQYGKRFPRAIEILEEGLEDLWRFMRFRSRGLSLILCKLRKLM